MAAIDEMDMLGFLRIRAWEAQKKARKRQPKPSFIDQVWPDLK